MIKAIANDKRLVVSLAFLLFVASVFWLGSRYPSLNAKALMGDRTEISGIAFDILIERLPDASVVESIIVNTVNWVFTNWKGMTFGVIFGASLLTILSIAPRRSFNGYFANSLMGTMIGAPLGVCVNCAAPIAQGLHEVGMRRETTLATLIASPSLNVIVVTISFALLPFHLAMTKLVAVLIFLLFVIPIFSKLLDRFSVTASASSSDGVTRAFTESSSLLKTVGQQVYEGTHNLKDRQSLYFAFRWFTKTFARNLLLIARITVPLMFVAGFLGAAFITLVPFDILMDVIAFSNGAVGTLIVLTLIAAVSLILPVPISFDVIFVSVLLSAGWPDHFAMAALLGLGTFSIYSFLIVGRAMGFGLASVLSFLLFGLSLTAAVVAYFIQPHFAHVRWEQVDEILNVAQPRERFHQSPSGVSATPELGQTKANPNLEITPFDGVVAHEGRGLVSAEVISNASPSAVVEQTKFSRVLGTEIGLDLRHDNGALKQFKPFTYFGGIAAGDFNGDGWHDIVMGSDPDVGGFALYVNSGGTFVRQSVDVGPLEDVFVNQVAFADLNNDGNLDLLVSTYLHGTYVLWNRAYRFAYSDSTRLPNGEALMMGAVGFADLDNDGDLDIVAGNWTAGPTTRFAAEHRARDHIIWNDGGQFHASPLQGVPGDTLTLLIADVDDDGADDILIGDDSFDSDKVYISEGDQYRLLKKSDGLLPYLGEATMSLDSGDINNDLKPDLYLSQITEPDTSEPMDYCDPAMIAIHGESKTCKSMQRDRAALLRASNPSLPNCARLQNLDMRTMCAIEAKVKRAASTGVEFQCSDIPEGWHRMQEVCKALLPTQKVTPSEKAELNSNEEPLGRLSGRSLLFKSAQDAGYVDIADRGEAHRPGWSWNARFFDVNQDGWQDILVATGYTPLPPYAPNALYLNEGDGSFSYGSKSFNLEDSIPTASFVFTDFDRDGDVDIIRAPSTSGVIVHRNDGAEGSSFTVRIKDSVGNSSGVGARVIIKTKTGQQMRDVKASGGFASFDPIAAHFGVSTAKTVDSVTIRWRDDSLTKLEGPLDLPVELVVSREKSP